MLLIVLLETAILTVKALVSVTLMAPGIRTPGLPHARQLNAEPVALPRQPVMWVLETACLCSEVTKLHWIFLDMLAEKRVLVFAVFVLYV